MKEKGMRSAIMPKAHFERNINDVECCDLKYASQSTMENPEDLKKSVDSLAKFVKTHQMKY
jgi:hypothetical protein